MKVGIFYGSTTCYTEMAAEKIKVLLESDPRLVNIASVSLHNIKQQPLSLAIDYELLIFGISTWDFGELQEDWEANWQQVSQLPLQNQVIAIYGMGDQIGYTEWFVDALGMLSDELAALPVERIGFWPTDGYEFEASKAATPDGDWFVGLALDEENQYDLSDQRLLLWCQQIVEEYLELVKNKA